MRTRRSLPLLATLTLASIALPAGASVTQFVETFDDGSNVGNWSWSTFGETIEPAGGNPGAYLEDLTLFFCCPAAITQFMTTSVFTGDYRALGVTSVGVDLATLSADQPLGDRPLTLILVNDNGTPAQFSDDRLAYLVGPEQIPAPGAGWESYDFDIPSQSTTLPPGWATFPPNAPDIIWEIVITDVSIVRFNYGDPDVAYPFLNWDLGLDNPRITMAAPPPGDIDGDCDVDVTDLLALLAAWGGCPEPCPSCLDLDGDCQVAITDLLILLANWG